MNTLTVVIDPVRGEVVLTKPYGYERSFRFLRKAKSDPLLLLPLIRNLQTGENVEIRVEDTYGKEVPTRPGPDLIVEKGLPGPESVEIKPPKVNIPRIPKPVTQEIS